MLEVDQEGYIQTTGDGRFCRSPQLTGNRNRCILTARSDRKWGPLQLKGDARLAGLSSGERELVGHILAREKPTVRVEDILEVQAGSRKSANKIISRLHRKGWLRRLKRGLYSIVPLEASSPNQAPEDAWLLAMEVFAPCYISGWSAAEHWNLTEQIFNGVSVASAHPQRKADQSIAGVQFTIRTLPKIRIFGTQNIWHGSHKVTIADPHRLLIDILDTPSFGGGARHTIDVVREYWKSPHCDPDKLLEYAKRYKRGAVFKRLGFTAEYFGKASQAWLDDCRGHISSGISRLDPGGQNSGRIVTRWRLRINIPLPTP